MDTKGIFPIMIKFSAGKILTNIEKTISAYEANTPLITNIHAASLVLGQIKIARKAAAVPRISLMRLYINNPESIKTF